MLLFKKLEIASVASNAIGIAAAAGATFALGAAMQVADGSPQFVASVITMGVLVAAAAASFWVARAIDGALAAGRIKA